MYTVTCRMIYDYSRKRTENDGFLLGIISGSHSANLIEIHIVPSLLNPPAFSPPDLIYHSQFEARNRKVIPHYLHEAKVWTFGEFIGCLSWSFTRRKRQKQFLGRRSFLLFSLLLTTWTASWLLYNLSLWTFNFGPGFQRTSSRYFPSKLNQPSLFLVNKSSSFRELPFCSIKLGWFDKREKKYCPWLVSPFWMLLADVKHRVWYILGSWIWKFFLAYLTKKNFAKQVNVILIHLILKSQNSD